MNGILQVNETMNNTKQLFWYIPLHDWSFAKKMMDFLLRYKSIQAYFADRCPCLSPDRNSQVDNLSVQHPWTLTKTIDRMCSSIHCFTYSQSEWCVLSSGTDATVWLFYFDYFTESVYSQNLALILESWNYYKLPSAMSTYEIF